MGDMSAQNIDRRLAARLPPNVARRIAIAALRMRDDPHPLDARARVPTHVRDVVAALEGRYLRAHQKPYVVIVFGKKARWAVVKDLASIADVRDEALWPSPHGYTVVSYEQQLPGALPGLPQATFATWQAAVHFVVNKAPLRRAMEIPGRTRVAMHLVAATRAVQRGGYARRATSRPAGPLTDMFTAAQTYARHAFT